jgi:hypothetical protein
MSQIFGTPSKLAPRMRAGFKEIWTDPAAASK